MGEPVKKQVSFRTTAKNKAMLEKAKILIEVVDGKSYNKQDAIIRIHEKFLEDHSEHKRYCDLMKPD